MVEKGKRNVVLVSACVLSAYLLSMWQGHPPLPTPPPPLWSPWHRLPADTGSASCLVSGPPLLPSCIPSARGGQSELCKTQIRLHQSLLRMPHWLPMALIYEVQSPYCGPVPRDHDLALPNSSTSPLPPPITQYLPATGPSSFLTPALPIHIPSA